MNAKNRLKKVLLSVLVVLFLGIIYYILNKCLRISIPCLFHCTTGLYCPGCGTTRLFMNLLNLDFDAAYKSNRLVFILLPFAALIFVNQCRKYILYNDKSTSRLVNTILNLMILSAIVFGILRNIPCFYFLRPIN